MRIHCPTTHPVRWAALLLAVACSGGRAPPPPEVPLPTDPPELPPSELPVPIQEPAPGFDWDGAIQEYIDANTAFLGLVLQAIEADPASRERIVEEARDPLWDIPGTLGPANAALPDKNLYQRLFLDITGAYRTVRVEPPPTARAADLVEAWFAAEPRWGVRLRGEELVAGTWASSERIPDAPWTAVHSMEPASNDAGFPFGPHPTLAFQTPPSVEGIPGRGAFVVDGAATFRDSQAAALTAALPGARLCPLSVRVWLRSQEQTVAQAVFQRVHRAPLVAEVWLANVGPEPVAVVVPDDRDQGEAVAEWRVVLREPGGPVVHEVRRRVPEGAGTVTVIDPGEEVRWATPLEVPAFEWPLDLEAAVGQLGERIDAPARAWTGVTATPAPLRVDAVPAASRE